MFKTSWPAVKELKRGTPHGNKKGWPAEFGFDLLKYKELRETKNAKLQQEREWVSSPD